MVEENIIQEFRLKNQIQNKKLFNWGNKSKKKYD